MLTCVVSLCLSSQKAVRAQFLERMEEDAKKKQEKKDLLLRTVAAMDKECTFMPKVTAYVRKGGHGSHCKPGSSLTLGVRV